MEADVRGLLKQFSAIRAYSHKLRQRTFANFQQVKGLIQEYGDARENFDRIKDALKLKTDLHLIVEYEISSRWSAILLSIEIQCEKAIGTLESITIPLPKEDLDQLSSLREELKELSVKLPNVYFEKNADEAIKEYEQRHFLASALISGRVLIYALDQISGKSIEEKIETLQKRGIIDKERKDLQEAVTKADKKARNFFSHDIKVTPSSSDALSLLGDTLKMLKYITEISQRT